MTLKLYNTLTRRKEEFVPHDPSNVRMYVCGPTVYQRIHIGNARPLVVFDVLFRLLRHLYGADHVTYVRNITDIDDRIINQVREDGVNGDLNAAVRALTDTTTEAFREDWRALGCLPPTHEPRATDHIPGMIAIIGELIEKGHAYAAEGHVLFHVPSMPAYGRLSGRSQGDMIAGARVEVAPYKRHPADFVLWKPSTPELPGWDSPWGRGRPGWHIECSAMSEALLGVPFDIHGGGQDLIFPHHENEIAQSCCAHGLDEMASIWMHNGFVNTTGEKMSKSLGNVLPLYEAIAIADNVVERRSEIVRLALLSTHYRKPIDLSEESLARAKQFLDRFYDALDGEAQAFGVGPDQTLVESLCDDLNIPLALTNLESLLGDFNRCEDEDEKKLLAGRISYSSYLLGLVRQTPDGWLRGNVEGYETIGRYLSPIAKAYSQLFGENYPDNGNNAIDILVSVRSQLRENGEYASADKIRHALGLLGIQVADGNVGVRWRRR